MFDDDLSVVYCSPSPRPAKRPRSRVQNAVAAAAGHANRRRARSTEMISGLKSYPAGIDPNFADRISARKPYLGPRHFP